MHITRRLFLASVAPAILVGCTAAQQAQWAQQWSNFVDQVNSILSKGCSSVVPAFVATANTIEAVAAILYPGIVGAISGGIAAVQAVAGVLCKTTPSAPPAQLRAKLRRAATTNIPTFVGNVVINGQVVPVNGYGIR